MTVTTNSALLRLADYPYLHVQETQFGDMDTLGHINNVAIVKYYENARTRFFLKCFEGTALFARGGYNFVIAELTTTFLGETHFPAPVSIGTAVVKVGNSSLLTRQAMYQADVCVGECQTTLVLVQAAKSLVIPPELRACLAPYCV